MGNVWVFKFDGTIQCDPDSVEITLEEMRQELSRIIGEGNIVSMEKRSREMIQLCGMPTGSANAYEITEEGWYILNHGIVGRLGFCLCSDSKSDKDVTNIGQVIGAITSSNPVMIRELVGHPLRIYKTGDAITKDWRPERVNIELSDKETIVDVWFG